MHLKRGFWAGILCVVGSIPSLDGQTAYRPYAILGPARTSETMARSERLQAILWEGWKLGAAEAAQLEMQLSNDLENLPARLRLISYYTQFLHEDLRTRHILWLIENHPEADAFQDATTLFRLGNQSSEYAHVKALWQQQASRFPNNSKVLASAATALSGEPEIALQLIQALRTVDPRNMEWVRWLAKTYANAIRWTFWDGKSMLTFTGGPEDYRHPPIQLPLPVCESARREVETSADAILVRATGEALLREVRLLREWSSRDKSASFVTPELQQVHDFGEMLAARARMLDQNK